MGIINNSENKFKCDKCKFITNSETGLKSHISKKHKKKIESVFCQKCNLCDKELNSTKEIKKHMITHSYKEAQFKCNQCDFIRGDKIDMEVHAGRMHGDSFECGVCDYEGKDLETLDIHLTTCECYKCALCGTRINQLTKIIKHFQDNHKEGKKSCLYGVRHVKPSRENKDVYDKKYHSITSFFPELTD